MGLNYRPVVLLAQEHRKTCLGYVRSRPLLVLQGLEGSHPVWRASESGVRLEAIKFVIRMMKLESADMLAFEPFLLRGMPRWK